MRHRLAALGLGLLVLPACQYKPSALGDWRDDPSCGRYENRNEPVSAEQERANRCLLEAFEDGRPAELVVTYHTVEGDPITEYYRILGPNRLEGFIDSTRDSYANGKWSHVVCDRLAEDSGFVYAEGCREIPVDVVVTEGYG